VQCFGPLCYFAAFAPHFAMESISSANMLGSELTGWHLLLAGLAEGSGLVLDLPPRSPYDQCGGGGESGRREREAYRSRNQEMGLRSNARHNRRLCTECSEQKARRVEKSPVAQGCDNPYRRLKGEVPEGQEKDHQKLCHHQIIDVSFDEIGAINDESRQKVCRIKQSYAKNPGDREGHQKAQACECEKESTAHEFDP
jgi:hypothetical protein